MGEFGQGTYVYEVAVGRDAVVSWVVAMELEAEGSVYEGENHEMDYLLYWEPVKVLKEGHDVTSGGGVCEQAGR